jgi:uncharacterized OB-fold protein
MSVRSAPEVEHLFVSSEHPDQLEVGDRVQLIAGICAGCEVYFFPKHAELHRPGCPGGEVAETLLSADGELVSYTVQRFAPPPPFPAPDPWSPTGIGTVLFAQGLQVPGEIVEWDLTELRVGLRVEVVAGALYVDDEGVQRLTWKFRPVNGELNKTGGH